MNEFEKIKSIWIEKSAEYIWLHNESMKKVRFIINLLVYQITFFSYLISIILIAFRPTNYYFLILLGLTNLYSAFLFTIYINRGDDRIYEQHHMAKYRFKCLFNEICHETYYLGNDDLMELLMLKEIELKNIIGQSPHIQEQILNKFRDNFKHIISNNSYLRTDILFGRNPKEYKKSFYNMMSLVKYFNIWKRQYIHSKNKMQQIRLGVNLGHFHNENKLLYSFAPLIHHKKIFEFQNIKLGNNNFEIKIK